MSNANAFQLICAVVGEMSFALVKGKAGRDDVVGWIRRLRMVADALEAKL